MGISWVTVEDVKKMKKLLLGAILLALSIVVPNPTLAGVDISIGISLLHCRG